MFAFWKSIGIACSGHHWKGLQLFITLLAIIYWRTRGISCTTTTKVMMFICVWILLFANAVGFVCTHKPMGLSLENCFHTNFHLVCSIKKMPGFEETRVPHPDDNKRIHLVLLFSIDLILSCDHRRPNTIFVRSLSPNPPVFRVAYSCPVFI